MKTGVNICDKMVRNRLNGNIKNGQTKINTKIETDENKVTIDYREAINKREWSEEIRIDIFYDLQWKTSKRQDIILNKKRKCTICIEFQMA